MYFAEAEATTGGRGLECARGRIIGGSSSINAMTYTRGNRGDYDRWAASGLANWSYAHVLPYFRRQESWKGGASFYRGGDGPLSTQMTNFAEPLTDAFAAAGQTAGYKTTPDCNGAQQEGFSVLQMTVRDGRRCSAADAYLRPALARNNLTVETHALVTRLVFDGRRVAGVDYVQRGKDVTARAEREIILCGGVINSPQLLMLSGIGDPEELRPHGIDVRVALPGVGKNLQDHISASVAYTRKTPGPVHREMRFDRIVKSLASAYYNGEGLATELPTGRIAFLKSRPDVALPDIEFIFNAAPFTATPYFMPFRRPYADAYACRAVVLRPESRGRASNWSRPIRNSRFASGRTFSPPTMIGRRCAPGCAWRVTSAARRRCNRSWSGRSPLAKARSTMPISTPISARIRSPSIIRSAPAKWAWRRIAWRLSIRSFGSTASRVFASSTAR